MLPVPSKTEIPWTTTSWTRRTAISQCPVAAGSRGRNHPAAPTPPRQALIDRVRLAIAAGTYETPAKLDALLPQLAHDHQLATHPAIEGGRRKEGRKERGEGARPSQKCVGRLICLAGERTLTGILGSGRSKRAEPFRRILRLT